ncbi:MAG TPA: hypothetical protein VKZ91_00950 [Woeseiaceae bacterium]|nr:hypothetical protein [Woeseiaceae bacterium]
MDQAEQADTWIVYGVIVAYRSDLLRCNASGLRLGCRRITRSTDLHERMRGCAPRLSPIFASGMAVTPALPG